VKNHNDKSQTVFTSKAENLQPMGSDALGESKYNCSSSTSYICMMTYKLSELDQRDLAFRLWSEFIISIQ